MTGPQTPPVTRDLVAFAQGLDARALPETVRRQALRALVDAVGCMLGGARHEMVDLAHAALADCFGPPRATILGRGEGADPLNAVLLNGTAGAAWSFFDSYSDALLHPGVPAAAVLLALSELRPVSGPDFLSAFAAGIEVACRLTRCTALPPARASDGWSQTGIICGAASGLAAGKLIGLDATGMERAFGIAASEAAGTRTEHGTMAAALIFGHTAQTGLRSALLAERGFTSAPGAIEHRFGLAHAFAESPNLQGAIEGLGQDFVLDELTFKPFPSGIVLHAATDAMLRLKAEAGFDSRDIASIALKVSPRAATFGMRPEPANEIEAKLSLHHWGAVAAAFGRAGLSEGQNAIVRDPEIVRLRAATSVIADEALAQDAAEVTVTFADGTELGRKVDHCVGSTLSPMSDADLDRKFLEQADPVLGPSRSAELLALCWSVAEAPDAGQIARLAR